MDFTQAITTKGSSLANEPIPYSPLRIAMNGTHNIRLTSRRQNSNFSVVVVRDGGQYNTLAVTIRCIFHFCHSST
ncbi:hypothetical protein PISMIDRAFT_678756 [Pisolithus microcarpus 441]|uniref:Unplaced genomic scaffold scaffold_38, whole genome shotgun sequence n=1 Tax=Pisolithus microcarpus 441 TaxID=765257 RepID=A0A0C9YFV8_9AGAM|nr:hypothetical protein PISMIDRAFT_678756 [Pisolithus microcarpus 441]